MLPDPLGGRSIPEWIGSSPDAKVPDRVRERVFLRAGGVCHISGRKIMPGDKWQVEHIRALSLGGDHRESNLAPALDHPHKEKSAQEADWRAKADRQRRYHFGLKPKPARPMRSRPKRPSRPEDTL
jgi:5-methylcytosine-specific restriction endonuclease McrA